jgi:hypothetical protein
VAEGHFPDFLAARNDRWWPKLSWLLADGFTASDDDTCLLERRIDLIVARLAPRSQVLDVIAEKKMTSFCYSLLECVRFEVPVDCVQQLLVCLRHEKMLAFALVMHPRLGERSIWRLMGEDILRSILLSCLIDQDNDEEDDKRQLLEYLLSEEEG